MNLILALLIIGSSGSLETYVKKLKKLERELKDTRVKLRTLKKKEKNILKEVKLIEREEKIVEEMIKVLRERERRLEDELMDLERRKKRADSLIEATKERIKEGLIFLYKLRGRRSATLPLGFESALLGYHNAKMMGTLLKEEENLFKKVLEAKRTIETYRVEREKDLFELNFLKEDLRKRERELKRIRAKKKKALLKIKRERKKKESELRKLRLAIKRLEKLIAQLERERELERKRRGIKKGTIKGRKIIWPVEGKIITHFGTVWHPRYNTKIKNNGIDIKANPQAPVVAVDDGEVVYSAPFLGYDNLIIIDHNGYFSVYGNLGKANVRNGDRVIKGAIIGYLKKDDPVLHFELRIGGRAVNPIIYLP